MNNEYKQLKGTFLGCLATAVIFIFILKNVKVSEIHTVLLDLSLQLFMLSIVVSSIINIIVPAIKFKGIVKMLGLTLTIKEALLINVGCIPLIVVFPLKAGELSKSACLNKIYSFPLSKGIASIVLNLGGNVVVLFFMLIIGTLLYTQQFNLQESNIIAFITVLLFMLLIFMLSKQKILIKNENKENESSRGKIKESIYTFLLNFTEIGPRNAFFIMGLSTIQIFGELLNFFLLSKCLGLSLPFKSVLFFIPLSMLITKLPIAIIGIGPRESSIIVFFLAFAEKVELLSLGMLYSLVEYIFPTIVGLIYLPFLVRKISTHA